MRRIAKRDLFAIIIIALVAGIVFASPAFEVVQGLSVDALTALRWQFFGNLVDPVSTPVVVVAIDEETYQTPPFKQSPTLTWTREIGRVLTAIVDGGATVVGFDIVQRDLCCGSGALCAGFRRPCGQFSRRFRELDAASRAFDQDKPAT
jgi:adenylate cyclase